LQRSLDTSDLGDAWDRLDAHLRKIVTSLRASKEDGKYDSELITLPVKMGGMGILSHRECSTHARAASIISSDKALLRVIYKDDEYIEEDEETDIRSQGERCREAQEERKENLMKGMTDFERKAMVENGLSLGRCWLTALPVSPVLQLTNYQISVALHYRLLTAPPGRCSWCAQLNHVGIEGETLKILEGWKRAVDPWQWRRMWERISMSLVRMRGMRFEMK
jgi:hypothetical protein